ncbi:MAG: acetolactate synthase small subunit [Pseudomonadota bacterium]|nr:acetolactate synthase small subunit [Pseudomonadota bacterium]
MPNSDKAMHTLSVYVANKPGALARIAQVFARRGFNIESLVVSPAVDGNFSRMTITCSGDPTGLDQIIKQLSKLIDVLHCIDHTYDESVMKEMGLVKVAVDSEGRSEALQIAEHYGCKTVDLTPESMILQVVGNPDKIDALEEMISKFRIVELVRTGKVVMSRGHETT